MTIQTKFNIGDAVACFEKDAPIEGVIEYFGVSVIPDMVAVYYGVRVRDTIGPNSFKTIQRREDLLHLLSGKEAP